MKIFKINLDPIQYKLQPKIFFRKFTNLILSYFNIIKQSNTYHNGGLSNPY